MTNDRPVTVDEARVTWVRLYRKGREKGGWVYLDESLLRDAGVDPDRHLMVKRYPMRPEARGHDGGPSGRRGRIVLNISYVTETKEDGLSETQEGILTRQRRRKAPLDVDP